MPASCSCCEASVTLCSISANARLFIVAGQLLIQAFQNFLLALRFGESAFQFAQLALHRGQLFLRLLRQRSAFLGHGIALGQALRQFLLRLRQADAGFHPLPAGQSESQNGDDRPWADPARFSLG